MFTLNRKSSLNDKAQSDLAAAQQARTKLIEVLPHYREQAKAFTELAKDGYVSKLQATDNTLQSSLLRCSLTSAQPMLWRSHKERELIEKEQDLKTQEHIIASARATLTSSSRKLEQISADYRQRLQAERADISVNTPDRGLFRRRLTFRLSRASGGRSHKLDKTQAEVTKQEYRNGLLELKAPQDGIIKDVATHTIGTVISPGTILMTLVPKDEILRAEVWVSNEDVGFIHQGDFTKIKFASYQFQKYGMVDGQVAHLSADATDNTQQGAGSSAPPTAKSPNGQPYSYRALVDLKAQELIVDGIKHTLSPGMQVTAEIHLGTRTIFEYLLSPVMKAFQEAGRER